ncbi:MAG: hypothetical protein LAT63_13830 [Marinobacter sp.]|nr:hypothetical protein [Marinobacter sp.]
MSLLNALNRMSASLQAAADHRTQRQAATDKAQSKATDTAADNSSGNTDSVTLSAERARVFKPQLKIQHYKYDIGQDHAVVKETLRHKLAEYELNPATRIGVEKDPGGKITLNARMPDAVRARIEQDLNNNQQFKSAFYRLSVNEPALEFVDNVMKLNHAYGVKNPLLDSITSENEQFNGLQDLVHRYDTLRRNVSAQQVEAAGASKPYAFSYNA